MKIDWDHIYLVGYYDKDGELITTTYYSPTPTIDFVVTNTDRPPLWHIAVPSGAKIHGVPDDKKPREYAKEMNGLYAWGFCIDNGFERA